MATTKTGLVVTAHPGDFVWRAGGAIALHVKKGYRVKIACLSFGERGESQFAWKESGATLEKVKAGRRDEAQRAAGGDGDRRCGRPRDDSGRDRIHGGAVGRLYVHAVVERQRIVIRRIDAAAERTRVVEGAADRVLDVERLDGPRVCVGRRDEHEERKRDGEAAHSPTVGRGGAPEQGRTA